MNAVAFSRDGGLLASGDANGAVFLRNVATGQLTATFRGPVGQAVNGVAISPDGATVAATTTSSSHTSSSICVWNARTGQRIATFHDPKSEGVFRLAFSPDGSTLAVGDANANTYLWNMTWVPS